MPEEFQYDLFLSHSAKDKALRRTTSIPQVTTPHP